MMNSDRRQFFRNFLKYAEHASHIPRTIPRPPTALQEKDFTTQCTGCGECAKVCPNEIIYVRNQLAELDLELSHCAHCHQCKDACPTSALSNSDSDCSVRPKVTSNCNPDTAIYCAECLDSCPVKAITIEENRQPSIDSGLCNGCSLCHVQCPCSAIELVIKE